MTTSDKDQDPVSSLQPCAQLHILETCAQMIEGLADSESDRPTQGGDTPGNIARWAEANSRYLDYPPGKETDTAWQLGWSAGYEKAVRECAAALRKKVIPGEPECPYPVVPGSTIRMIERHAILTTLRHVENSPSLAAKMLGLSTRTIQNRVKEYRSEDENSPPRHGLAAPGPVRRKG